MTLYLHIAMQKTGTTALQRGMAANKDELLRYGVMYPSATLGLTQSSSGAHHYLAHALKDIVTRYTPDIPFSRIHEYCSAVRKLTSRHDGPVVLSSEDFSLLDNNEVAELALLLPPDTRVIVYLRRQDYWADSLYGQMLKVGLKITVEQFLDEIEERLDYQQYLERWVKAFGSQAVIVRTYEQRSKANLWTDFCTAIGTIAAVPAIDSLSVENPSLTKTQTDVLALMPSPAARRSLRRRYEKMNISIPKTPVVRHLDAETASLLVAKHEKGNAEVAKRFIGREQLFLCTDQAIAATTNEVRGQELLEAMHVMFVQLQNRVEELEDDVKRLRFEATRAQQEPNRSQFEE